MSEEYKAIDFVEMYANRVKEEEVFDQVDDMLRAAAILTVKSDEVLDSLIIEEE